MAYTAGDPRYGFAFTARSSAGVNKSKTVNNINIAMGGSSAGYTPDEVGIFINAVADSIIGGIVDADKLFINAQYPLNTGE